MVPQFPLEIILMAGLSVLAEQKGAEGGGCGKESALLVSSSRREADVWALSSSQKAKARR